MEKKISVIVRTYNSAGFIGDCLESILRQDVDVAQYEVVVVDDGSTDATREVLQGYGEFIRVVAGTHEGAIVALNKGIAQARGDYITILDSDDVFRKGILKKVIGVLKDTDIDFLYTDYAEVSIDGHKSIISLAKNIFNGVSAGVFIKKEVLKSIGGYNENLIFPEYDVIIQVMEKYRGVHLAVLGFIYKRRKESLTGSKELVQKGKQQLFAKYGKTFPIREY